MRRANCQGYYLTGGKARIGTPYLRSGCSGLDMPEIRIDLLWIRPVRAPRSHDRTTLAPMRLHDRQSVPSRTRRRLRTWERLKKKSA